MADNLTNVWIIIKSALGIGFVVFVHELGHFLMAKWNGVKVTRFSIGFGRPLISYRHGVGFRVGSGTRPPGPDDPPEYSETEYVLAILPLGGYVMMLGQNLEGQGEETDMTDDPRSFNRKSVFARMQIITAGVIMNLILGVCCFSFVYSQGWTDLAAHIGTVLPGSTAYKAGLRSGDEIVAIDGRRDVGFSVFRQKVNYSGAGQKLRFTIKRLGVEGEQTYDIEPVRQPDDTAPTIGVLQSASVELDPLIPFDPLPGQLDATAKPVAKPDPKERKKRQKERLKVIAVGPEAGPLEPLSAPEEFRYEEFLRKSDRLKSKPIVVEVERTTFTENADGQEKEEKSTSKLTVPTSPILEFGFRLTPGPIAAVRPDSPAQRAGLKEGDRIVAVNGDPAYDPMKLPDLALANAGRPLKLTIAREVAGKTETESLEIAVTPDDSPIWTDPPIDKGRLTPLDVPGLGLALAIEPKIQAVAEGSPALKAGLKVGQILGSVDLDVKRSIDDDADPGVLTIELGGKTSGWPMAFTMIQQRGMKSIKFHVKDLAAPIEIRPAIDPERFQIRRGLRFFSQLKEFPPQGVAESFRRGFEETVESAVNVVFIFRNMTQGRVGHKAFNGIVGIGQAAYMSASGGWVTLIHFLGILSINLAVLNFLPIPPLDGGQFLILAAEKIRGRPLPEAMINILMIGGVIFVLILIVLVNGRELIQLVTSYLPK